MVEVVHAGVMYDCEYSGESYMLVIRNALYIRSMTVTLIPPFMMRLAKIEVDECPKFLCKRPTEKNHSLYFTNVYIRIPLKLDRIISYLPCRMPSYSEVPKPKLILELTPVCQKR